nr:MAG TPA: hypothetical protein [Caudoviricetes sp.]
MRTVLSFPVELQSIPAHNALFQLNYIVLS